MRFLVGEATCSLRQKFSTSNIYQSLLEMNLEKSEISNALCTAFCYKNGENATEKCRKNGEYTEISMSIMHHSLLFWYFENMHDFLTPKKHKKHGLFRKFRKSLISQLQKRNEIMGDLVDIILDENCAFHLKYVQQSGSNLLLLRDINLAWRLSIR